MDSLVYSLSSIGALITFSAFFSGSETALMSSSQPKLHALEKDGLKSAKKVIELTADPDTLLSTILLGNNLVNILASAIATGTAIKLYGDAGIAFATFMMTILVLMFAEVLPKTLASRAPESFAMVVCWPMSIIVKTLKPFTIMIRFCNTQLLKLFGIKAGSSNESFDEHDVRGAIGMGLSEGVFEKGKHQMLDSILDLTELTVEDVMVHRSAIESINAGDAGEVIYHQISNSTHSRLPVWENNSENIIGIVHVKDFYRAYHKSLSKEAQFDVRKIMLKPTFIPENANLDSQLMAFKKTRQHMALVVDEYGDIQGLLSLEDILEEIVGEIEDEHDKTKASFIREDNGSITLHGNFPVRDANREFNWELPEDEDAVTIAGLLIEEAGHIPTVGEKITINNITFCISAKKRQAVLRVNAVVAKKVK